VKLDIKIEEELLEMSLEEAQEMEIQSHIDALIIKAYEILGLMTFLTTGEDETRAWTIKKNSTAPVAGMAIHTDFKDKFIRADVIQWDKLLEIGSWSKARETGLLRTEGKDYIVADGDVIEFKI
jgi:ribosome-binding ATPase YchF (GTP1/OBG family)